MPGTPGDDELIGGPGDDLLDGEAGFDLVTYAAITSGDGIIVTLQGAKATSAAASRNTIKGSLHTGLPGGSDAIGIDRINRVECVIGTDNTDTFVATTAFAADLGRLNEFEGRGGNDTIKGNGETRVSYRGATAGVTVDLKLGSARSTSDASDAAGIGEDDLQGGINWVVGSDFDDSIRGSDGTAAETFSGWRGNDHIDGGLGLLDRVDYLVTGADAADVAGGVAVDLAAGLGFDNWGFLDQLTAIERVRGSALEDHLIGNGLANELDGDAGDDLLEGGGSADKLVGGGGFDTASYASAAGPVTVTAGTGAGNKGEAAGDKYFSIECYALSEHKDTFKGTAGSDTASGLGGADTLAGGAGDDKLDGGDGTDTLRGEAGNDILDGGCDGDVLEGGDGNDALIGSGGDDRLTGGKGGDLLDGGSGFDTASYASASGAIVLDLDDPGRNTADATGDVFVAIEAYILTNGSDIFSGGSAADTVWGGAGNDRLEGKGGGDALEGGAGADMIDGGDGDDTATYLGATAGIVIDLGNAKLNSGDAKGDVFVSVEAFRLSGKSDRFSSAADTASKVWGEDGADTLTGGGRADQLQGGGGADVVRGLDGEDQLSGGADADLVDGGAGSDLLDGGEGDDWLIGGAGGDVLIGGAGEKDTASYESALPAAGNIGVSLDFSSGAFAGTGDAAGDTFSGIERFLLSAYDDRFFADPASLTAVVADGGAGDDILVGSAGDDHMTGGTGSDVIDGGTGNNDQASYATAKAGVTLDLASGLHKGDASGDTLIGIEAYELTAFDDVFIGGGDGITILGGNGSDRLTGGAGDDFIDGGAGADILDGGGGWNTVSYATASAAVTINMAKNAHAGGAAGDKLYKFTIFELSEHNDKLTGSAAGEIVAGAGGVDVLDGGGGDDTLSGGMGDDMLTGGTGADVIDGGAGFDTASYKLAMAGVALDLAAGIGSGGEAYGDILIDIERFELTKFADTVVLAGQAATIIGGTGNDMFILAGGGARHTITDFKSGAGAGDMLDLSAFGFADLAAVKAAMSQITSRSVLLHLDDDDAVLLSNTTIARFAADDFKLG